MCETEVMSQANPLRLFVTHAWEMSDDYLRVFEYLESAQNFFYRNFSTGKSNRWRRSSRSRASTTRIRSC